MGCIKALTLSGACVLETCETKDAAIFGSQPELYQVNTGIAYSPDHCYCMMLYFNDAFTNVYIGKYDITTNTLIQKHDFGLEYPNQVVYDSTAQKFVLTDGTSIFTYDPVTESVDSFNPGLTGSIGSLLYVSQKSRVYGIMGVNGSSERFVGYIDLNLQSVVQLGIFPAIGAGRPSPNNGFAYSTVADSLYGNWASGVDQRMVKFDLSSNTASYIVIGLNGASVWWDSDRNLLITRDSGNLYEFDTSTDAVTGNVPFDANFTMIRVTFKDQSTNTIWGRGDDLVGGFDCLVGLDLDTSTWILGLTDYIYGAPIQFGDNGSCIAPVTNLAETESGIRKVCVS